MKQKAFEILDLALGLLALVFGASFILQGIGFGFASAITGPLSSGPLGILVGVVFLAYAFRFFRVLR